MLDTPKGITRGVMFDIMWSWMVTTRQWVAYITVRCGICVIQALPVETSWRMAAFAGWLASDVLRIRGEVVSENIRHAYPELQHEARAHMARQMWQSLFGMLVEIALLPRKVHRTNWRRYVRLTNPQLLMSRLLDDRPTILCSAHFGNFEVAGYVLGLLGFPTYTVARTLDNPFLDRYINRFRGLTGQHILPKSGGYEQIAEVLESHGTVTFLADQHAGSKGYWVEFFGRPASTHKAIAFFSLYHDAPLVIGYACRVGGPLEYELVTRVVVDPRDDVPHTCGARELTAWFTGEFEAFVRSAPQQYWWLHRRWKARRPPRRRVKKTQHTTDEIVAKLRQVDVQVGKGQKVAEVCNLLEITEETYRRWRQKCGRMLP
jgi:KDO2-lipid IV(A) lauroyltransferase